MANLRDPRKRKQKLYQPRNYRRRRHQEMMQIYASIYMSGSDTETETPSYILGALARYFDS